mgnify:CR=1 FL=1
MWSGSASVSPSVWMMNRGSRPLNAAVIPHAVPPNPEPGAKESALATNLGADPGTARAAALAVEVAPVVVEPWPML